MQTVKHNVHRRSECVDVQRFFRRVSTLDRRAQADHLHAFALGGEPRGFETCVNSNQTSVNTDALIALGSKLQKGCIRIAIPASVLTHHGQFVTVLTGLLTEVVF